MRRTLTATLLTAALLLAGCTDNHPVAPDDAHKAPGGTLRVLAGSELADLEPILADMTRTTGVKIELDYTGTLDGVEQVTTGTAGKNHQAVWFSANRYLELHPDAGSRIGTQTKVMSSPVVLGLKQSVAKSLGWDTKRPSWSEVADAAAARRFSYGMTNPAASNSGFSALVALATALTGKGTALTAEQVGQVTPRLRQFFEAQSLTSGSSGWLADTFMRKGGVDGLVNYESVLLSLNAGGKLAEPLTVVYPTDGVVTADYPLTLLAGADPAVKDRYQAVVDYLRRPETQKALMERTFRRPAVPGVGMNEKFGGSTLFELPFPVKLDTADALIDAYNNVARRPSTTIYVLDLSGSMNDDNRLTGLKAALLGLTGADTSLSGRFSGFHQREQVTLLPFSSAPMAPRTFTVPPDTPGPVLDQIKGTVNGFTANGSTAIYDALREAYKLAAEADPGRVTTIVLLTDGEVTAGASLKDFTGRYQNLPPGTKAVPVFPVLFGESAVDEMKQLAALTGGRTFDGRTGTLSAVFKEIRGYQ
ncbi:VWA domain-containing protein [Longispora fulva]|uniref:Ca-activated chloride channel family protein n=1 Tax=Longispora fulva TaxID=619741 RepID=A0A8J7KVN0_9ACTN|nr:VWA domain-containing protein [Longispora fulva]MBG6135497.1 Ca-activated chloride channel family protein [Longispora fulva]GIG56263.1 VWA domain-containing protein [Longispora fulva]